MKRCRVIDGVFIPECYGGVFNGKSGCYCPPRNRADEIEKLEARVARLEEAIAELKKPSRLASR